MPPSVQQVLVSSVLRFKAELIGPLEVSGVALPDQLPEHVVERGPISRPLNPRQPLKGFRGLV